MATITIQPGNESFDCPEGDTILRAALRAGLGMPYSCNVGSCGNCRFQLIEGAVEHARADPPAWGDRDLKRNRWLGCQARPQGDCTIKFRIDQKYVPAHTPRPRRGTLQSVTPITRDISEFAFTIDGEDGFEPGQYALLTLPGIDGPRAYSMCNLAGDGAWRFQIRKVPGGAATTALFDKLTPGDEVAIDGPYGTAFLQPEIERDIVLLAGGSGLSPMVSIARGAQKVGLLGERRLHFYYGCRAADDAISSDYIDRELGFAERFVTAVSDPQAFTEWDGPTGFLHDVVLEDLGESLKDHEIYFAGPAVMSAAVQKMAYEAGVPLDQLHFDEFF